MRGHNTTKRSIALTLAVLLTVCNLPLLAADKSIGSVSSVGSVQLRGVALSSDGTLFSGDRLTVGPGSSAKVVASAGQKLQIEANSNVVVSRDGDNTNLQMASGNVGFKGNGKGTTRVQIGEYDVVVSPDATGNIAFVGSQAFGVRLSGGSATVRNTQTKKSFVVQKGSERLVSLTTGENSPTLAQLASAVPAAVPAPALPRRQGSSKSTGMWVSIVAAAVGSTALITYFLAREDGDERAAQNKAMSDLVAITQTAAATSTAAAQAAAVASQAQAAINASSISAANKTILLNQVATINSQANSAAQKITTLNAKITALESQISSQDGGPTPSQQNELNQLLADLNSARIDANNAIASLNALLAQANALGVPGLPANPNLQPVPPPAVASASIPV
jgi:hypothetical protein